MSEVIKIPKEFGPELKQFYQTKILELDGQIKSLHSDREKFLSLLNSIDNIEEGTNRLTNFDKNAPPIDNAIYFIDLYGELSMKQMAQLIWEKDKTQDLKSIKNTLSASLTYDQGSAKPRLKREKNLRNDYIYSRA